MTPGWFSVGKQKWHRLNDSGVPICNRTMRRGNLRRRNYVGESERCSMCARRTCGQLTKPNAAINRLMLANRMLRQEAKRESIGETA